MTTWAFIQGPSPSAYEIAVLASRTCGRAEILRDDEIRKAYNASVAGNAAWQQAADAGEVAEGAQMAKGRPAPSPNGVEGDSSPWNHYNRKDEYKTALQREYTALKTLCEWAPNSTITLEQLGDDLRNLEHMNELGNILDKQGNLGTSGATSAILGLNQAEMIRGITKWAIKRAEEEIMQAFLRQWLDSLRANDKLALMLPTTLNTISTTSLGALLTDGEIWRSSFKKDLDKSPERLDSLLVLVLRDLACKAEAKKRLERARTYDELACAGHVLGDLYRALLQKKDLETELAVLAGRLMAAMPELPVSGLNDYTISQRAIILADVLFQAMAFEEQKKKRNHLEPLAIIGMEKSFFALYWKTICVMHAQGFRIGLAVDDARLGAIAMSESVVAGKQALVDASGMLATLKQLARTTNNASTVTLSTAETLELLDQVLGLLESGAEFATHLSRGVAGSDQRIWPFFTDVARPMLDELKDVHGAVIRARYGDVVTGLVNIGTFLSRLDSEGKPTPTVQDARMKRWADAINKYGGFMADIIEAENSDEVEASLKRVTAGVGSYRVKMISAFSVDLTLFPGAAGGFERVSMDPGKFGTSMASAGYLGGFLPIGLSFTIGTGGKYIPSIGLYAQAVDLGAALSYEIDSPDSVAATPAYAWDMMLSPGGYFTLQMGRSPITLGLGGNLAPRLREVNADGLQFRADAVRLGAFLGVDITALHLYSSRKKLNTNWLTYGE